MNYTKGEWKVGEPFGKGQDYPIYGEDHHELVRVFIHNGEQEANARLVSAAPDMYGALTAIREYGLGRAELQIDAALAKAEGK